jgi:ribonuclease P protein subunit RPR2
MADGQGEGSTADRGPQGFWDEAAVPDPAAAMEAQLLVFANELGTHYQRERDRAARLEQTLSDLQVAYHQTVRAFTLVVEAKDANTSQHVERSHRYGAALVEALGVADENREIEFGFLLHDVGKVAVPEHVLNKPGPLSAPEWRAMRTHPLIGYQLIADIPFLQVARLAVLHHHECFDGTGYPDGLRGGGIPLPARILSVVDVFDSMTSVRPYRPPLALDEALSELERMAGSQLDPEIVAVFIPLAHRLAAF